MALITLAIQQEKKKIGAINQYDLVSVDKFNSIADTVESSVIPEKLSPIFWQAIVRFKDQPRMQTLLNGTEYDHCSGNKLKFEGLYYIIAHWNYIEYVNRYSFNEGQKGIVAPKENQNDSYQPLSKNQIDNLLRPIYSTINTQFDLLLEYISYYSNLYPEYICTTQRRTSMQVSTGFRKTHYLRNK